MTKIVKRLKHTKAFGVDEIQIGVWKKEISVLAGPIAHLCNMSLSSGVFPDMFKKAIIHPIYKGNSKNPHEPSSYHRISILPSISKILEIAVRDALVDWLIHIGFIPDSQFGYFT